MTKTSGFAFAVLISLILNLHAESGGYQEWLKRRDALKQDKSVVRYYTFEDVKDSKSIVKDLGGSGADLTFVPYKDLKTGEVFDDLQVTEGRWPAKKAVRLNRGWYQGLPADIKNKQFTVEIWFRKNGVGSLNPYPSERGFIISSPPGWGAGWRIETGYTPTQWMSFDIGIEKNNIRATSEKMYTDKMWHYLAATWDGRDMRLYVNGTLAASHEYTGEYFPGTEPFKIGYRSGTSILLDVDEVVIYDRVLSAEEIKKAGAISEQEVFSKADAYLKTGDYKNARAEYEKLKGLPGYGTELALFNTAESYRLEKDYANAHKTFKEIFSIPNLTVYYRIYGLFREADVYLEQKHYTNARKLYEQVTKTDGALEHHVFTAGLKTGDTYKLEKKYASARSIYERLLKEQESSALPHEDYRLDLRDRLEEIDGLADGAAVKSRQEKLAAWVNRPKQKLYISPDGNDSNPGTKGKPFASIKRAQEEVRKIKANGMPEGGIVVYLRGGKYFVTESVVFGKEDSGTAAAPVVYRSYPGEEARIIGGRQISGFKILADPDIIKKLPDGSKEKVWVADLKAQGITDYGKLTNRGGYGKGNPSAMELFFNGKPMWLARWPNTGYARVAGLSKPDGEATGRGKYQNGEFKYSGNRPERWLDEKDVWLHGFWYFVYAKDHVKLKSIDTKNKTISLYNDTRWHPTYPLYKVMVGMDAPYYVYNLLSELDAPGEWYIDSDTGKLYFYPPDRIAGGEILVSTLDAPLVVMNNASNTVLSGLTMEVTRRNAVDIKNGRNNMIVKSTVRNTGQWAIFVDGGWEHKVIGCDMHGMGEGGVSLRGGDRIKLIPDGHVVDNNHIYSFNRFDGGYRQAVIIDGIGERVSHNVIHDSPMQAIYLNANDNIIEFNEIHDVPYEGREIGSVYMYGEPWYLMSRGDVIRNNFFHHISTHSSPNTNQGLNAIHIDAINGGIVMGKNIFYKIPNGISNSQPENRLENNMFIDAEIRGISQGNRAYLFNTPDGEPLADRISALAAGYLKKVHYKQPPWSYRYPQLVDLLFREKPVGWAQNNVIERNINTGGAFLSISGGIKEDNIIRNNWDGDNPLFIDKDRMNFNIRPGSPVYGITGCEPLAMEDIGVYKDEFRASWPINRTKEDIGKYYKADWKPLEELAKTAMAPLRRVSPPAYYNVALRKNPIVINGKLEKDEWDGLGMKNAMVISQQYQGNKTEGAKSNAWLLYDKDNLYIALKHDPDPYTGNMPARLKKHVPIFEIAIESQNGSQSRSWWIDDMVTGPIYSITGNYAGEFWINNMFGMPNSIVKKLEQSVEYKVSIQDENSQAWTAEMKIPFAGIGVNIADAQQLAFNIGTYKRADWFAWVATGSYIWRVENAGSIKFVK